MEDPKASKRAEMALRIIEHLKLIDSCSGFGRLTFKIRNGDVIETEVTIIDHRPYAYKA